MSCEVNLIFLPPPPPLYLHQCVAALIWVEAQNSESHLQIVDISF